MKNINEYIDIIIVTGMRFRLEESLTDLRITGTRRDETLGRTSVVVTRRVFTRVHREILN